MTNRFETLKIILNILVNECRMILHNKLAEKLYDSIREMEKCHLGLVNLIQSGFNKGHNTLLFTIIKLKK